MEIYRDRLPTLMLFLCAILGLIVLIESWYLWTHRAVYQPRTQADTTISTSSAQTTTISTPSAAQQILAADMSKVLTVQEVLIGTGPKAQHGDTMTVRYTTKLKDGTVVRDMTTQTFVLGSSKVIGGFNLGLLNMQTGGVRQLLVPPEYGYGSSTPTGVPQNIPLQFEVYLVNLEKAK